MKLVLSKSDNGPSIVKKVTDVYLESARGSSQIMATPSEDNKSVTIQIDHLRCQKYYSFVFELYLNADLYEAETIFQGVTILRLRSEVFPAGNTSFLLPCQSNACLLY